MSQTKNFFRLKLKTLENLSKKISASPRLLAGQGGSAINSLKWGLGGKKLIAFFTLWAFLICNAGFAVQDNFHISPSLRARAAADRLPELPLKAKVPAPEEERLFNYTKESWDRRLKEGKVANKDAVATVLGMDRPPSIIREFTIALAPFSGNICVVPDNNLYGRRFWFAYHKEENKPAIPIIYFGQQAFKEMNHADVARLLSRAQYLLVRNKSQEINRLDFPRRVRRLAKAPIREQRRLQPERQKLQRELRIGKLYTRAVTFYGEDKLDEATGIFNQIIKLDPNHQTAKDYLTKKIPERRAQLAAKKEEKEEKKKEKPQKEQPTTAEVELTDIKSSRERIVKAANDALDGVILPNLCGTTVIETEPQKGKEEVCVWINTSGSKQPGFGFVELSAPPKGYKPIPLLPDPKRLSGKAKVQEAQRYKATLQYIAATKRTEKRHPNISHLKQKYFDVDIETIIANYLPDRKQRLLDAVIPPLQKILEKRDKRLEQARQKHPREVDAILDVIRKRYEDHIQLLQKSLGARHDLQENAEAGNVPAGPIKDALRSVDNALEPWPMAQAEVKNLVAALADEGKGELNKYVDLLADDIPEKARTQDIFAFLDITPSISPAILDEVYYDAYRFVWLERLNNIQSQLKEKQISLDDAVRQVHRLGNLITLLEWEEAFTDLVKETADVFPENKSLARYSIGGVCILFLDSENRLRQLALGGGAMALSGELTAHYYPYRVSEYYKKGDKVVLLFFGSTPFANFEQLDSYLKDWILLQRALSGNPEIWLGAVTSEGFMRVFSPVAPRDETLRNRLMRELIVKRKPYRDFLDLLNANIYSTSLLQSGKEGAIRRGAKAARGKTLAKTKAVDQRTQQMIRELIPVYDVAKELPKRIEECLAQAYGSEMAADTMKAVNIVYGKNFEVIKDSADKKNPADLHKGVCELTHIIQIYIAEIIGKTFLENEEFFKTVEIAGLTDVVPQLDAAKVAQQLSPMIEQMLKETDKLLEQTAQMADSKEAAQRLQQNEQMISKMLMLQGIPAPSPFHEKLEGARTRLQNARQVQGVLGEVRDFTPLLTYKTVDSVRDTLGKATQALAKLDPIRDAAWRKALEEASAGLAKTFAERVIEHIKAVDLRGEEPNANQLLNQAREVLENFPNAIQLLEKFNQERSIQAQKILDNVRELAQLVTHKDADAVHDALGKATQAIAKLDPSKARDAELRSGFEKTSATLADTFAGKIIEQCKIMDAGKKTKETTALLAQGIAVVTAFPQTVKLLKDFEEFRKLSPEQKMAHYLLYDTKFGQVRANKDNKRLVALLNAIDKDESFEGDAQRIHRWAANMVNKSGGGAAGEFYKEVAKLAAGYKGPTPAKLTEAILSSILRQRPAADRLTPSTEQQPPREQGERLYLLDAMPWQGLPGRGGPLLWFNKLNYTLRGTSEFVTMVSNDSRTAQADAQEFIQHLRQLQVKGNLPEVITVQEWGIGNGRYAADFLDVLKSQAVDYYLRIKYILCDFSRFVIDNAHRQEYLRRHSGHIQFVQMDATELPFANESTLLIRHNELYDDLPAQEIVYANGHYCEVWARPFILNNTQFKTRDGKLKTAEEVADMITKQDLEGLARLDPSFLEHIKFEAGPGPVDITDINEIPYGKYITPILQKYIQDYSPTQFSCLVNIGAIKNLEQALAILDKECGYIRFYDYAIVSFEELNRYNALRRDGIILTGGTITTYLNLMLLKAIAEEHGFKMELEPQIERLERAFGEEFLTFTHLGHATNSLVEIFKKYPKRYRLGALGLYEVDMIRPKLFSDWEDEFQKRCLISKSEFIRSNIYAKLCRAGFSRSWILRIFLTPKIVPAYYAVKISHSNLKTVPKPNLNLSPIPHDTLLSSILRPRATLERKEGPQPTLEEQMRSLENDLNNQDRHELDRAAAAQKLGRLLKDISVNIFLVRHAVEASQRHIQYDESDIVQQAAAIAIGEIGTVHPLGRNVEISMLRVLEMEDEYASPAVKKEVVRAIGKLKRTFVLCKAKNVDTLLTTMREGGVNNTEMQTLVLKALGNIILTSFLYDFAALSKISKTLKEIAESGTYYFLMEPRRGFRGREIKILPVKSEVRREAIIQMANVFQKAVQAISQDYRYPNGKSVTKRTKFFAIEEMFDAIYPAVIDILDKKRVQTYSSEPAVRLEAVRTLRSIVHDRIEALAEMHRTYGENVGYIEMMENIRDEVIARVGPFVYGDSEELENDDGVKMELLNIPAEFGSPSTVQSDKLLLLVFSENRDISARAVMAILKIGDKNIVGQLTDLQKKRKEGEELHHILEEAFTHIQKELASCILRPRAAEDRSAGVTKVCLRKK